MRPFFDILCQSLVGIRYSGIQIAHLIKNLFFEIALVEVVGEIRSKVQCQDLS